MNKTILAVMITAFLTTAAAAEQFTYIVPSSPDGGIAKHAQQVTKEWSKFLAKKGHSLNLRYMKQQKGKKAATEFATTYKDNPLVILQSKGIIMFMTSNKGWKGYDPRNYVPIFGQKTGVFMLAKSDLPKKPAINIGGGAETIVDAMSAIMMECGNMSVSKMLDCQKDTYRYIKGWQGSGSRRKGYLAGDIQITRDAFKNIGSTYKDEIKSGKSVVWFSHGIASANGLVDDPSINSAPSFPTLFTVNWKEAPRGAYYNAYKKMIELRSTSKYVMVHPKNPYYEDLLGSFNEMINDKESMKKLNKKLGAYPWASGAELKKTLDDIYSSVDKKLLKDIQTIRQSFGEKTKINRNFFK